MPLALSRHVGAVEQRWKLRCRRDAVHDQLVFAEPSDHVEVDHSDAAVERDRAIRDEVLGTQQTHFLTTEGDEDDRTSRRRSGEQTRELEDCGGARRVVICAAANCVLAIRIESALGRSTQMIEVCSDDYELTAKRRIA